MPLRTFTTAGVNNLWSNPANWDVAPVDNDSVIIPLGQTCEFDVDLSAWATGVNGITITGTLKLTRTAGTYYLKMKAAATITGAGTFDCGTALSPIPFAAKHTITGGAGWYIQGSGGMTMTVYATEPAIKSILLTAGEPLGETVIAVDTDVTGDIWAAGNTIRIDNINKGAESEERVIAPGGIAAGTITITVGLTAAKLAGAYLHLITRHLRFVGVGVNGYVCINFQSGKLIIAGGEWATAVASINIIRQSTGVVISAGTFSGAYAAIYSGSSASISGGVFSGNTYALYQCPTSTLTGGTFTGISISVLYVCHGTYVTGGLFRGVYSVAYTTTGMSVSGVSVSGCTTAFESCAGLTLSGGTINNNTTGVYRCSCKVKNVTFASNTYDIRGSIVEAFNTSFASAIENYEYTNLAREVYSESIDHDVIPAAFRAWTKGGITSSQAGTVPAGYTQANQTVLESATVEGFWQKDILVAAGASVNFEMWLRKDAAMAYLPRCLIFNKALTDPFAGGATINTFTMTNSIDTWESSTYVYSNLTANDVTLVIRFQGMNAAGNVFTALTLDVINVDLTSALALLAAIKAKTDQLIFTIPNQVDANALSGGTTAVAVRQEMDLNSTQLAAILLAIADKTGYRLSAAGVDDVLDDVVEGGLTLRQMTRIMFAALAGKASGGGTNTIKFRDVLDGKDRIAATVTDDGNRTAIVLDGA